MNVVSQIRPLVVAAIKELYGVDYKESDFTINVTKPEFEGDYTIVLFSLVKELKRAPEYFGKDICEQIVKTCSGFIQ